MRFVPSLLALTALLGACGGGGAAAPVDVTELAPGLDALEISPPSASIPVGSSVRFTVTPMDAAGAPMSAPTTPSFATDDPAVATVDDDGVVKGVAPGVATVQATMTLGVTTRTAEASVTVTAAGDAGTRTVHTPGTSFDPASLTVSPGDTVTWEFSGAVHNVTFTSAAPPAGDIADQPIGTAVTRVFPAAGSYPYECTIHTGMAGEILVRSEADPVFSGLEVAPATPAVEVGGAVNLSVTPVDQFGLAMTGLAAPTFASSAPDVAAVDGSGTVTGVATGTATVTASITAEGVTHSGTSIVTVLSPAPNAVTVTTPNRTFSPTAVTIPTGGTVTWQFSEAVHNVTFGGAAPTGGDIADQDPGNAVSRTFSTPGTYDYTCTRHDGMVGEVIVTGEGGDAVFTAVTVSPGSWAMVPAERKTLIVTPVDQNGVPMSGLPAPTFASSDPGIATVSTDGVVTAVGIGSVTVTTSITANGDTFTAAAAITVVAPGAVRVAMTEGGYDPDPVDIAPGGTVIWDVTGDVHNITFDPLPPGGNVADTPPGDAVARTFTTVDDYDYECTIHGETGRVRVR